MSCRTAQAAAAIPAAEAGGTEVYRCPDEDAFAAGRVLASEDGVLVGGAVVAVVCCGWKAAVRRRAAACDGAAGRADRCVPRSARRGACGRGGQTPGPTGGRPGRRGRRGGCGDRV